MTYLGNIAVMALAKCFTFDNDNAWGILWKAKFHSWKKPPERADMTWREYYHFTMQHKIDKSEEFLNDAENFLAHPRRQFDRFVKELERAETSFNFKINYRSTNRCGATFLSLAVLYGRLNIVEWLVEAKKSRINSCRDQEFSPLIYAAIEGSYEITEYLLRKGADCEHKASGKCLGKRCIITDNCHRQRDAEEWASYQGHRDVALKIGCHSV